MSNAARAMFERLDALVRGAVLAAGGFAAVALFLWGGALLLSQCITWLRDGLWQAVPGYAVLLTDEAREFQLRITQGKRFSPLDLVPALGSYPDLDAAVAAAAGKLVGLGRIVAWLLAAPLTLWLWALGILTILVTERFSEAVPPLDKPKE